MVSTYDAIYLAPHLDDVALSCGGQIFQHTSQGGRVLIVTVMAGDGPETAVSDYATALHDRWAIEANPTAGRRAEDVAACQILGADYAHLPIPDCIYRINEQTNTPFYRSDDDIFGTVHPQDKAQLRDVLLNHLRRLPEAAAYYIPLGIGHHVDHQLTRWAAETTFPTNNIFYYEDYPYAQKPGAVDIVISNESKMRQSKTIPLSNKALEARLNAIAAFTSQLSTFFNDWDDLVQQVSRFVEADGGERIWRKTAV